MACYDFIGQFIFDLILLDYVQTAENLYNLAHYCGNFITFGARKPKKV